jgi:hypothetical protein
MSTVKKETPAGGQASEGLNGRYENDEQKNHIESTVDNQGKTVGGGGGISEDTLAFLQNEGAVFDAETYATAASYSRQYNKYQLTADYVEKLLSFIDPNDLTRDDWLKVTLSIRALETEHGLDLHGVWDRWSGCYSNRDPNADDATWKSAGHPRNISGGTLFHYAAQSGWSSDRADIPLREISADEVRARKAREKARQAEAAALAELKQKLCRKLWENASATSEISKRYFRGRGNLSVPDGVFRESQQTIWASGELASVKYTNIVSQIRDFETGAPIGLHLNAVQPATDNPLPNSVWSVGNVKHQNGRSKRFTPGSSAGYIDLVSTDSRILVVAEGVETALSVSHLQLQLDNPNIRALVNDQNFAKLPPLPDIDQLYILADIEESGAGIKAARTLASNWAAVGKDVRIVTPILKPNTTKRDLNDVAQDLVRFKREAEEGIDYEIEKVSETVTPLNVSDIGLIDQPDPNTLDAAIHLLNKKFFFVPEGGNGWVVEEGHNTALDRPELRWHKPSAFKQMYMNRLFPTKGKPPAKMIELGDAWLKSPRRRQYLGGVEFDPQMKCGPETYNKWRGFSCVPVKGEWPHFRDFLLNVICDGRQDLFDYAVNWIARMMQLPWLPGEVAFVMQGEEGAGKGTLARFIASLIASHSLHLSDPNSIIGRFNDHLEDAVFLFADEAFFAGDHAGVNKLKHLVTEPTASIEAKHRGRKTVRSCTHIMMASNDAWIISAGRKARRWFVLRVPSHRLQDTAYFAGLDKAWRGGENAAFLDFVLNQVDLTGFHPSQFPSTDALAEQKLLSLQGIELWWYRCLYRGYLMKSRYHFDDFEQWHPYVTIKFVSEAYSAYAKEHNMTRYEASASQIGKYLIHDCKFALKKDFQSEGKAIAGERLETVRESKMEQGGPVFTERKQPQIVYNANRTSGYDLHSLSRARQLFCEEYGVTVDWPKQECEIIPDTSVDDEIPF